MTMQVHICLQVNGRVQGVGFRPFISVLANQLQLSGYVMNQVNNVIIYLIGEQDKIDIFEKTLLQNPPKHACITALSRQQLRSKPTQSYQGFEIRYSSVINDSEQPQTGLTIPADRAVCSNCISELFEHTNKRFLHPFITCTECGPRASIIRHLPYDRAHTSHHKFTECDHCVNESSHLINKQAHRFHSQTNSCWNCGPTLSLFHQGKAVAPSHQRLQTRYNDYFDTLANAIKAGEIIALKGLSGFHLMCDARNHEAINTLRNFKNRPEKPFAVMALNSRSLNEFVDTDAHSEILLKSESAPIVLHRKNSFSNPILEALAPRVNDLGCILPYTAIHYLLFYALLGKPKGHDWLSGVHCPLLAVTSANAPGEPLITDNQTCIEQMSKIATYILCHDRDILFSNDDSVIQNTGFVQNNSMIIRRSRGFAPEPFHLPFLGKRVLALGAHLKHTFCISDGERAYLSPHLGEPESIASIEHFESILNQYLKQLSIKPEIIACDSHPDFFSSQFAKDYAKKHQLPLIQIPHHQAHIASTLTESKLPENSTFVGLALDGIGLGENHQPNTQNFWGGELFIGNMHSGANKQTSLNLKHHAQLSQLSLPGGDKASREIGRIGFALFASLNGKVQTNFEQDFSLSTELKAFIRTHSESFPKTSSLGRWFDAVSSLLGLRQTVTYEGQAAMELEAFAARHGKQPHSKQLAMIDKYGHLNLYPILPAILSAKSIHEAAAIFHSELIDGLLRWVLVSTNKHKTQHVICGGGCFQNRILRDSLFNAASKKGLIVHYPRLIPTNDAGISLGQALLASLR